MHRQQIIRILFGKMHFSGYIGKKNASQEAQEVQMGVKTIISTYISDVKQLVKENLNEHQGSQILCLWLNIHPNSEGVWLSR